MTLTCRLSLAACLALGLASACTTQVDEETTAADDAACDADGDGHAAATAQCGGDDCCDADALVYPGQEQYFVQRNACHNHDYDCDGAEELRWPAIFECGSGCTFIDDGWRATESVPACGETGTLHSTCAPGTDNGGGMWCGTDGGSQRIQICR